MTVGRTSEDVVVITGIGGMGIAVARRFGVGRSIVLADDAKDSLERVAEILRGEGHSVHPVELDVSLGATCG